MTPAEAERFCEPDKDAERVLAAFDAGPKGLTALMGC